MATSRIVLEQFSHLDWDWLNSFPTNVDASEPVYDTTYFGANRQPANVIFTQAHDLLTTQSDYRYAVCEIGFLEAFGKARPDLLEAMIATGRLSIVGGGITSPDNLLPNGECFFRNYVVGLHWMRSASLPWTRCVWLPDDFGHDSQLPAILEAMDALAVGFARCPLAPAYQGQNQTKQQPLPQAGVDLLRRPDLGGGCDFWWSASDGSRVFAHWMPHAYSQGSALYTTQPDIKPLFDENRECSPTTYVHIPVSNDFQVPLGGGPPGTTVTDLMLKTINDWNKAHPDAPATLSTFEHYVQWVLEYLRDHPSTPFYTRSFHGDTSDRGRTTFRSNPYWMGHYASRMNIKSGHQQATRMMLAAETLDAILFVLGRPVSGATQQLLDGWAKLVPSTHHDYINGTATDLVVQNEQMPLLDEVKDAASKLMTPQLDALAAAVSPSAPSLMVYNPFGVALKRGLVSITPAQAQAVQQSLPPNQTQKAADGNVLVYVDAPSAGYKTFASAGDFPKPPAAPTVSRDAATIKFANGLVSAMITQNAGWSLINVTDLTTGAQVVSSGNTLSFYYDGGNIYEFGYECDNNYFSELTPTVAAGPATITESGPLRVTVSATINVTVPIGQRNVTLPFTLQYSLAAGSPYLEMTLIGKAPRQTSVFASFDFGRTVTRLYHGTPMHFELKTPATFGTQTFNAVMEPTHDYVFPLSDHLPLGAIYHQAVPGWAMSGTKLIGAVLRDTPGNGCDGRGAAGSDDVQHTITYALRVPSGLTGAGAALQESRAYTTPLWAAVARPGSGTSPLKLSLANISAPADADTMLTAAKRGTFDPSSIILRVYQPNGDAKPRTITVNTTFDTSKAAVATALEQVPSAPGPPLTIGTREVTFTTPRAITTLKF